MSKSAIAIIVVCVLAIGGFYLWGKTASDRRAQAVSASAQANVVLLTRPVRAGEVLKAEDLVEKIIDSEVCPATAFNSPSLVVGMKAKADMMAAHMLLVDDVAGECDVMVEQRKLKQALEEQDLNWAKNEQK